MRVLGIDMGSKRVGLAMSDALGITAQGLSILERTPDDRELFEKISEIIKKEEVEEVVVGLPLNMDGTYGDQARNALDFADTIKKSVDIPVKLWDERMTTKEVERMLIVADTSRSKRKKKIDKLAAQVMLQSYLNARQKGHGNV